MAHRTLRKGHKKVLYPTLASVHGVFLVARALKDASAVTVFLRKPRAAFNTACLRQAACTGVFYNTFASRMPADKGAFKVSPALVIAQSGHVLPNVGPRRFACGGKVEQLLSTACTTVVAEQKKRNIIGIIVG